MTMHHEFGHGMHGHSRDWHHAVQVVVSLTVFALLLLML